ncbi:monovalent cation:proton antiporter-2 (CPA2) family protein [Agaribacterium haliotis]|uniref:monovalent cation:proton antiporter-2 (CPA2) family protein n=1 Tax=Agaribacterium haliotis TaxID=2013869 RepID=UPI000BB59AE8|nr:monovalent cation:proton antiporter-2 (CPA2) family protein [Agaribacterium haliotis]
MTHYFVQAFIYLVAAVIAVPIAKRLGLGSVLGYLIAGVVIGPLTGLVGSETVTIQHFAEFGVVMMLFLVGLELEPRMLWAMRNKLVGLGGLQLALTSLCFAALGLAFGLDWRIAVAIALMLSLSSTAIVLQSLQEKGLAKTEGGQSAFSVLLFQDIAVIPMLALIPLLALPELIAAAGAGAGADEHHHESLSLVAHLPGWLHASVVLASVAAVVAGGRYLCNPLFRFIANTGLREMFTAAALMLVIGIAALMSLVGLSPALGAFLAGVTLASSEFRHELETDIEPFKGILLGLFFITVGAGINFGIISENLLLVIGAVVAVMLIKALVLMLLAKLFKIHASDSWLFFLSLAQAGEFGFVLLSFSQQNHVLPKDLAAILSPVIALTMFLTPLLFIFYEKFVVTRYQKHGAEQQDERVDEQGTVIIAGIGRFGQIINRLLLANDVPTVVLDHSASMVQRVAKVNIKSWFGDASRPDLLHSAGIEEASMLVVAIDDKERGLALVHHVKKFHPKVTILARAFDRSHGYELSHAGADIVISETYYSALELGGEALKALGQHAFKVEQMKAAFDKTDKQAREHMYAEWAKGDEEQRFTRSYLDLFLEVERRLAKAIKRNRVEGHDNSEGGWTPPPKAYLDDFD